MKINNNKIYIIVHWFLDFKYQYKKITFRRTLIWSQIMSSIVRCPECEPYWPLRLSSSSRPESLDSSIWDTHKGVDGVEAQVATKVASIFSDGSRALTISLSRIRTFSVTHSDLHVKYFFVSLFLTNDQKIVRFSWTSPLSEIL